MRPQRKLHYLQKPEDSAKSKATSFDQAFRRDLLRFAFVISLILLGGALFFVTPALKTPAFLAVLFTLFLSPLVTAAERSGYPRTLSIVVIFTILISSLGLLTVWATQAVTSQFSDFRRIVPEYFQRLLDRIQSIEQEFQSKYSFLESVHPTEAVMKYGEETGTWVVTNGAAIMGDALTWLLIVPFLSFFMLKDGRRIRKWFFSMVPNRFFESSFMIVSRVTGSISDYIRAKLIEAFIVGFITTMGLIILDAPYAVILGIIAGITNIIPYLGPFLGAIPGVLIPLVDPYYADLLWPIVLVFLIANVIDLAFVFPVVVAHLVNLHPVLLLTAVILGQHYYGLVGMIISIPVFAAFKVLIEQVYGVAYLPGRSESLRRH